METTDKKERKKAYDAKYYAANRKRVNARLANWRAKNRERERARNAKYYASNSEVRKAYKRTLKSKYSNCKSQALHRGLAFELTFEEYQVLISANICNYCNGPLPEAGSGLDRIDSSLGYSKHNVVPCCQKCNMVLGDMPKDEAFRHMERMLEVKNAPK